MEEMKIREPLEPLGTTDKEPETMEAAPPWYQQLSFNEAKAIIQENIASASRSFIAVGYYLKYIRDRGMYREAGLNSIWEFAQEEYGISKSTASRYMTMNDRFSEDGNSPAVAEEYRGYGKSQLQEMLYLNDEQLEQVTPETQVKQIRELRQPAREIPYYELPGQFTFDDFPEVLPEPEKHTEQLVTNTGSTVLAVEDFTENEEPEVIAISQQEAEPDENVTLTPYEELEQSLESTVPAIKEAEELFPDIESEDEEVNREESLPEPEQVEAVTELQIAQKELERAQELLSKCLKDFPDEKDVHIRSMKIKVYALANYVRELDNISPASVRDKMLEIVNSVSGTDGNDEYARGWDDACRSIIRAIEENEEDGREKLYEYQCDWNPAGKRTSVRSGGLTI